MAVAALVLRTFGRPTAAAIPGDEPMMYEVAVMAVSGRKVAILGAAGGIGQPLALLLKDCDMIRSLALYDLAPITKGVAVDLSHCNTVPQVTGHQGADELGACLKGSEVVVITAGVPRKPGMTRDDLFNVNASIMKTLAQACATHCPKAIILIVANPVNSLVPLAAEVMTRNNVFDPRKVIGITTLDVVRANTWVAEATNTNPRDQNVVVVGGHAGTTIVPLLSKVKGASFTETQIKELTNRIQFGGEEVVKAKDGGGSATLSMAYAGAIFTKRLLEAMNGKKGVVECCLTRNDVTDAEFFAAPTLLGPSGAEAVQPLGAVTPFERVSINDMIGDLRGQIKKGVDFARA